MNDKEVAALERATNADAFASFLEGALTGTGPSKAVATDAEYVRKEQLGRQTLGQPPVDDEGESHA